MVGRTANSKRLLLSRRDNMDRCARKKLQEKQGTKLNSSSESILSVNIAYQPKQKSIG
jgi:hypothetical protein